MDSFSVHYERKLGTVEIIQVLKVAGFDAVEQGPETVHVSEGDSKLWIWLHGRDELEPERFTDVDEYPTHGTVLVHGRRLR
jgi:hypothetical protein